MQNYKILRGVCNWKSPSVHQQQCRQDLSSSHSLASHGCESSGIPRTGLCLSPDFLQSAPHTPRPRDSCLFPLFPPFSEPPCPGSHTSRTQHQKHRESREDTRGLAPSCPLGNRTAPTMLLTQHRCAHVCCPNPVRAGRPHVCSAPEAVSRCHKAG